MAVVDAEKERRLRWHCRRGLLELDLTLGRFMDEKLVSLTPEQVMQFEALLEYEDNDLWAVLTRRQACTDPRLLNMVEMLRVV